MIEPGSGLRIDRQLNLIIPILREDDRPLYVHAMPMTEEMFDHYCMILAQCNTAVVTAGLGIASAPAVAGKILRNLTAEQAARDGIPDNGGALAEIRRMANVAVPTATGWAPLPLQSVIDQKMITPREIREVEGKLTFFTVISLIQPVTTVPIYIKALADMWALQTTSSTFMDYVNSLPTLTAAESSGETEVVSSEPSSPGSPMVVY